MIVVCMEVLIFLKLGCSVGFWGVSVVMAAICPPAEPPAIAMKFGLMFYLSVCLCRKAIVVLVLISWFG